MILFSYSISISLYHLFSKVPLVVAVFKCKLSMTCKLKKKWETFLACFGYSDCRNMFNKKQMTITHFPDTSDIHLEGDVGPSALATVCILTYLVFAIPRLSNTEEMIE